MCAGDVRKKNAGCAKWIALRAPTPDRRKRKFCSFFIHRNAPGFRNFTLIIAGWKLCFSESFKWTRAVNRHCNMNLYPTRKKSLKPTCSWQPHDPWRCARWSAHGPCRGAAWWWRPWKGGEEWERSGRCSCRERSKTAVSIRRSNCDVNSNRTFSTKMENLRR